MKFFNNRCTRYLIIGFIFLLLTVTGGCNGVIKQGKRTDLPPKMVAGAPAPQQIDLPERIILNLTKTPWSSQAVTWRTVSAGTSPRAQITRVTEASDLTTTAQTFAADTTPVAVGNKKTVYHHSAIFTALSPHTLYAYRVGEGNHWSEWNQFKTAHNKPSPFKFIYFGDPQEQIRSMCSRIFRMAYKTAPDASFWHFIGDLVDDGDKDDQWAELFDAFGWIPRTTPMILLPGNHEYPDKRVVHGKDFKLFHLWRPHFTLPENGPTTLAETVYFIDYQGVRFVMLNGNEQLEAQAVWLDEILSKNPQRWTIAAIHQPVYSTGKRRKKYKSNPIETLFVPVFDKYSVDLVLQGHDHTYSRTGKLKNGHRVADTENGTVYVISVCGPKFYPMNNRHKDIMDKSGTGRQLFQVIGVDDHQLVYESYDAKGEIYDSFTLKK
jgi:hypothetical protein